MSKEKSAYTKLPGRGSPPFPAGLAGSGRTRLWLGPDHLLKVELNFCNERYRRFYLKDIQTIRVTRNNRWIWKLVISGGILLLWVGGTYLAREELGAAVFLGIMAALFLLFLIVFLVQGPTCTTRIETAIGGEDIHSLGYVRTARKVLARIVPLIREAQGGGDPGVEVADFVAGKGSERSFVETAKDQSTSVPETPHPKLRWLGWSVGVALLVHAVISGLTVAMPNVWGIGVGLAAMMAAGAGDVILMARPVPGCGRGLTGTVLGWFCIYGGLLYVLLIKVMISQGEKAAAVQTSSDMYLQIARQGAAPDAFTTVILVTSAVVSGVMGLVFLIQLLRARAL